MSAWEKDVEKQIAELNKDNEGIKAGIMSSDENTGRRLTRLEDVLRELGEKLIGWQSENQTDHDKKCFAISLEHTLDKLDSNPTLGDGIPVDARFPATDIQTEKKKCSECGAYLWSVYSPHNEGCSQFKEKPTEPENPDDREFVHFDEKLWISLSKHTQKQKELIEEFVKKLRGYLGCETCTSSIKPKSCKSCNDLYPIIEEYEARLEK